MTPNTAASFNSHWEVESHWTRTETQWIPPASLRFNSHWEVESHWTAGVPALCRWGFQRSVAGTVCQGVLLLAPPMLHPLPSTAAAPRPDPTLAFGANPPAIPRAFDPRK